MARTYKQKPKKIFRNPRHIQEERELRFLLLETKEIGLSKVNRIRKRLTNLPDGYDDLYVASYESKY